MAHPFIELSAATSTLTSASTSSAEALTATVDPRLLWQLARPANTTKRAASCKDNTPATQQAAISPNEWPMTASSFVVVSLEDSF